jgi:hypothetical protein
MNIKVNNGIVNVNNEVSISNTFTNNWGSNGHNNNYFSVIAGYSCRHNKETGHNAIYKYHTNGILICWIPQQ